MTRTRFLTSGLATLAVASAFTLAGSPAHAATADDQTCQPAVPAVYTTVVHPPVFTTIPAITHDEWRWQRDVTHVEYQYSTVVTPAYDETVWTRVVAGPVEYLWTRTVTDSPAVPAVPGTPEVGHFETVVVVPAVTVLQAEFQQQTTGKLRWESPDWGGGNGEGWFKTGNTRDFVLTPAQTTQQWVVDVPATPGTPAIPAVTHVESTWATSSPGADWSGPADQRPGPTSTETQTTHGDAPAGDGWTLQSSTSIPAVVDTVWAASAPAGYSATGEQRVASVEHQVSDTTSAAAPDGDGWSKVDGSLVTIVDTPAAQVLQTPGWTEQVLVTPAIPASGACIDAGGPTLPGGPGGGTDGGTGGGTGDPGNTGQQVDAPTPPSGDTAGNTGNGGDNTGSTVAAPQAQGAIAPEALTLPNTGGVPFWMAPAGLATMLAGAVLVGSARRRATIG